MTTTEIPDAEVVKGPKEIGEEMREDADAHNRETNMRLASLESALGPRYRQCSFRNFDSSVRKEREAVGRIKKWCEKPFTNLVLIGQSGTGKDHLAAAAARLVTTTSRNRVHWQSMVDLAFFGRQTQHQQELDLAVLKCANENVVVLSGIREMSIELAYIIDMRYRYHLPTIATLTCQVLDHPSWMRLTHNATLVKCEWEPKWITPEASHEQAG